MMNMNRDQDSKRLQINSYQPGKLVINQQEYFHSIVLNNDKLIDNWPPQSIEQLCLEHITQLAKLNPELVIIGTGTNLVFPKTDILVPLIENNIGYEIMNTAAASRTYTILAAEDRDLVVALIIE